MAVIERVKICMVDLAPKLRRCNAIQSFDSQEVPILRIHDSDSDGAIGTGYSYTIGQGGPAVIS